MKTIRNYMRPIKGRILTWLVSGAVVVVLLTLPVTANASCGRSNGLKAGTSAKLPASARSQGIGQASKNGSIVGLWHVTYYFEDGSEFAQSFDQWFADGNEVEAAGLGQGVACQGTWEQTAPRVVKLFHVGWSYDLNNVNLLIGSFTEEQVNTVSSDGSSYQGTYHFTFYDIDANVVGELEGTLTATRLSVN